MPGLERGLVRLDEVSVINAAMVRTLLTMSIEIIVAGCSCRKPMPGLFFAVAAKHGGHLAGAICVGDTPVDVTAAALLNNGKEAPR